MHRPQILSKESVKECESEYLRITGLDNKNLIELVGFSCSKEILKFYGPFDCDHIVIYAGPGKNGGDGLAIAFYLAEYAEKISICLPEEPKEDFLKSNINRIKSLYSNVEFVNTPVAGDIFIDALFGIGLNKRPTGVYEQLIKSMNQQAGPVISIDIPSGADANTSVSIGESTKPDLTLAIGCLKPIHKNPKTEALCGEVILVDIGLPHKFVEKYASIQKVA